MVTLNSQAVTSETPPEQPGPSQPESPTTTHYQKLAEQFLRDLDTLATIIPRQEVSRLSTKRHVRSHLNVTREFLEIVIASVEQTPELKATGQLDAVASRDDLQYMEAFQPVLDKMTTVCESLRFSLEAVKARLVIGTQQMYAITKSVGRDPSKPDVAKRAALMKQALGRRGPKRKKAEEPPATTAPAAPAKKGGAAG